jgi:WS/DGAT/MGAT family acyltransferase
MADQRDLRFEQKMSDAEAMMWNIEHDPRMSSNIGSIIICDQALDADLLRRRVAGATADIARLRERVAPVLGRLAPPVWIPDEEFDLDYHYRHVALPPPGDDRALFDLCTRLLQEPFDRTRPLWTFYVIEGLSGGRGALFTKLHHTITDGEGGVRLAERYMDIERDPPPPPDVDLDAVIVEAAAHDAPDAGDSFGASALRTTGHTWRRILGMARRAVGEVALAAADPERLGEVANNLRTAATSAQSQLGSSSPGSPLWTARSRNRYYDVLDVSFEDAKNASKSLGGSLNDFFVTAAAIGAAKYHEFMGAEAEFFNATFVVSTRDDRSAGGNAFTPSKVQVPGGKMDPADRFAAIRDSMGSRRGEVTGGADLMGAVSGLANLLPTSVVTGVARSQAASIDFATSNVRGAPLEVYVAGAKALAAYPMGPVAGTAWNITMMSYAGTLNVGVHIDPAAVADPPLLMRCLKEGFAELVAAGIGSGA